jgi:hypothetical protein
MSRPAYEEAWRVMSETRDQEISPRPELPPRDLLTRPTDLWEPVRFCGLPAMRHSADKPLPQTCQHVLACAMEDVERDLTLDIPIGGGHR